MAAIIASSRVGRLDRLQHIVLVGAGHAHVEVLRNFGRRPETGVRLTLITKSTHTPYSGMVPGFVARHYESSEIQIPIVPLAQFANCELVLAEAVGLDPFERSVRLRDGREIKGDVVSIDTGAETDLSDAPSVQDRIVPVKPIDNFAQEWGSLIERVETDPSLRIAIVGSGAAGVELALSIQHRLTRTATGLDASPSNRVTLVVDGAGILPSFLPRVRRRFARILRDHEIEISSDAEFYGRMRRRASTQPYQVIVWATGVAPAIWLSASGLALDKGRFVAVDRHLQSISHIGVFVSGDAGGMVESPRPKSGVIAVRQGPVLAENLRRYIAGKRLQPFFPQKSWLSLISTGNRYAVAVWGGYSIEGKWVWYWKRWVDKRFVTRYRFRTVPAKLATPNK